MAILDLFADCFLIQFLTSKALKHAPESGARNRRYKFRRQISAPVFRADARLL